MGKSSVTEFGKMGTKGTKLERILQWDTEMLSLLLEAGCGKEKFPLFIMACLLKLKPGCQYSVNTTLAPPLYHCSMQREL